MKSASNKTKKPAGGSALNRLKNNLKQLGLLNAKVSKKKKAGKTSSQSPMERESRREKFEKLHSAPNPFELKVNRTKHDVLGRKVKGTIGRPGVSRMRGNEVVCNFYGLSEDAL